MRDVFKTLIVVMAMVILTTATLNAAVVGYVESFDTQVAADSWYAYEWGSGHYYAPDHLGLNDDPFISAPVDDIGWDLSALADSSGGNFAGDYTSAGVTDIQFSASVDDYTAVYVARLLVWVGINQVFDYDLTYDFVDNDWTQWTVPIDDPEWYNGNDNVAPTTAEWADITGIGLYAVANTGQATFINLDDVVLVPEPATMCLLVLGGLIFCKRKNVKR